MPDHKVAEILLVEDDPIDVQIFKRAVAKTTLEVPLQTVESGEEALSYIANARDTRGRNELLVVTDINMPGLTGHELMEEVRGEDRLKTTVFFVLSSSDQSKDIATAYENGAAGYVVKGDGEGAMLDCVTMLQSYCATVTLP